MNSSRKKINILLFNMSTFADWQQGIVNRNYFILNNLLKNQSIGKIFAIDFIHFRKKRLLKDYYYAFFSSKFKGKKVVYQDFFNIARQINEKLFVFSTFEQIKNVNNIFSKIKLVLNALNFGSDFIIWNYNPLYVDYLENFSSNLKIFDTVDNWLNHSSFDKEKEILRKNYQLIAEKSDIIFTVSPELLKFYQLLKRENDLYFIPNGVNWEDYQKIKPDDYWEKKFQKIANPILGYLGSITKDRVDLDLIAFIAKNNPDKSIVLAGPIWPDIKKEIKQKLSQYKNIFFLGRIPYSQNPAVISRFDVCLNPLNQNKFVQYINPMKIYEYLALGKPIVSTNILGLENLANNIYFSFSKEDFNAKILLALSENSLLQKENRKQVAQNQTYQNRVEQMLKIINEKIN